MFSIKARSWVVTGALALGAGRLVPHGGECRRGLIIPDRTPNDQPHLKPHVDPAEGGPRPRRDGAHRHDRSKVTAAAEAAVPGATVVRVETDSDGAAYEAHMQKADGSYITVKFDSNFKVTSTVAASAAGCPPAAGTATAAECRNSRRTWSARAGEPGRSTLSAVARPAARRCREDAARGLRR